MKHKITCLLFLFSIHSYAQDVNLYQQFTGKVDFTMIGNTLNPTDNSINNTCTILTSSSATLNLDTNDQIEAAYLYWSGSGAGDFDVLLNGQNITAERTFSQSVSGNPVFGAFTNITTQIQNTGNDNYTLSELDLTNVISNYCSNQTNYGGWAIIIFYNNDSLPLNQINFYDGMQSVIPNQGIDNLTINLESLFVIDNTDAKIGFLAWEGDEGLAVEETLNINGILVSNPPLNPSNNVFNGTNSFTNSSDLHNMDLDFYNIEDFVNVGDTSVNIQLSSGQDFVMINAVAVKLNVELPDAIVNINSFDLLNCNNRVVNVNFNVSNQDDSAILPINTPISIYANDTLITTIFTTIPLVNFDIETFNQTIIIPNNIPNDFTLTIAVDDDGNGNSTLGETNEFNNEDQIQILLPQIPVANLVLDMAYCDDLPNTNDGMVSFDTSHIENTILNGQTNVAITYFDEVGLPLPSPLPNPFITTTQTVTANIENTANITCTDSTTFQFIVVPNPIANPVTIANQCDDNQDGFVFFDTSMLENEVLQGQTNVNVTYFNEDGSPILPTLPVSFETNSQTITIVVSSNLNDTCNDETTLEFVVDKLPFINQEVIIDRLCDDEPNNLDGLSSFDTSEIENTLLGTTQNEMIVHYYDENNIELQSPLPNPFTTATQTITVVIENPVNTDCQVMTSIDFNVEPLPFFNIEDAIICINSFPESTIVSVVNPLANYDYQWFNTNGDSIGNNSETLEVFEDGIYSVTATSQILADCSTTETFTITKSFVNFEQPTNMLLCDEGFDQAVFNLEETYDQITINPDVEISFFNTLEDLHLNENEIIIPSQHTNITNPQIIFTRVENTITNCYNFTTFNIEVYNCLPFPPNGFTPNNDGQNTNETFTINGLRDVFPDFEIYIYNRYGNLIFKGDNNIPDWDGTYKGKELPVGTYFYHLYLNDPFYTPISSWVYLNR